MCRIHPTCLPFDPGESFAASTESIDALAEDRETGDRGLDERPLVQALQKNSIRLVGAKSNDLAPVTLVEFARVNSMLTGYLFASGGRYFAGVSALANIWVTTSTGKGTTTVWLCSADTWTKLCKKRKCIAVGYFAMISAASASFCDA